MCQDRQYPIDCGSADLAAFYCSKALVYVDRIHDVAPDDRAAIRADAEQAAQLLARASPILARQVARDPSNRSWMANQQYAQGALGILHQKYGLGADGRHCRTDGDPRGAQLGRRLAALAGFDDH